MMPNSYKHLLVPLDGSELAELALNDALPLAQLCQAEITLLKVVVPIEHDLDPDVDEPDFIEVEGEKYCSLARQYLVDLGQRVGGQDLVVHIEAKMGSPAETIISYAHEHPIDLIVMATHGRSGLKRWVYGSVADKVLQDADVPVLLVRAYNRKANN